MAKQANKKSMQKKIDYYRHQNKAIYVRMREAEAKLDDYEQKVAAQVSALITRYEGLICYLMNVADYYIVPEDRVAEWLNGKEYALVAEWDEALGLVWKPEVKEVEDETED